MSAQCREDVEQVLILLETAHGARTWNVVHPSDGRMDASEAKTAVVCADDEVESITEAWWLHTLFCAECSPGDPEHDFLTTASVDKCPVCGSRQAALVIVSTKH